MIPTILIVEDEPDLLRLMKTILKGTQLYEVLTAITAEEGLAIGTEFPGTIHLLLVNAMLHGTLGSDLARQLREVRPEMRVILIGGKASGQLRVLQDGWQLLSPEYLFEELIDYVRDALRMRAAAS